jgi:protein gp37
MNAIVRDTEKRADPIIMMAASEARTVVEQVKIHVSTASKEIDRARYKLLDLQEREGWKALGYSNWSKCVQAEFGEISRSRLYQLLDAAIIERNLTGNYGLSTVVDKEENSNIPERTLRPLRQLKDHSDHKHDAESQRKAWDIANKETDGNPTPKAVQKAVEEIKKENQTKREQPKQSDFITLEQWRQMSVEDKKAALNFPNSHKSFNRQDNKSIEWAQWSWNPVTGCRHDCPYCYARDIASRFYPQGFEPSILPDRLRAPHNTAVPGIAKEDPSYKNVFVCSMADLFGRWVPAEWIEAVLDQVRSSPQWDFLFLTKFPKRMAEFDFPRNAWLGTSVDCQARVKNAERAFERIQGGTKWLSVEPLLEPLKFERLDLFDWIVVGGASASTQTPEWVPPIDWISDLHQQARAAGCRIYYKHNCGMQESLRIKEFPWAEPRKKDLPDVFRYLAKANSKDQTAEG